MIKNTTPGRRLAARGDHLRTVIFRDVQGVRYTLRLYDTGRLDSRGCSYLGYTLRTGFGDTSTVLFAGEDFAGSPMHADDSDATVADLLGFLTLKPGDTDQEYFASYTPDQLAWAEQHAEYLGYAVTERFGEH